MSSRGTSSWPSVFEAFDDHIRNHLFRKGLALPAFEELARNVARSGLRLKCYFMQKPVVGMSDQDAVHDIQRGIDYLSGIADRYGVPINLHLNPTFVSRGTLLEASFLAGKYTPPRLCDVARAALHGQGKSISIFIGLCDEGLATPGGTFIRPGDEPLVQQLEEFNRTQDYCVLRNLCKPDG